MMFYTDDPVADFERYDAEQERKLAQLPVCIECDEHIQDTQCYEVNGEYICYDCMNRNHRKWVDDIVC